MTNQATYKAEARRRAVDAAAVSFDLRHRERLALNREAVLANIAMQRALRLTREANAQPGNGD
jgi:hypothetical protein